MARAEVAAAVAGFRQGYEEHFTRVAPEFPRPMTDEEKVMREQLRLLRLIDDHEDAGHLSAEHANEARLDVLAGDLSGFELDDNPATREWVAEQERQREVGVRLFANWTTEAYLVHRDHLRLASCRARSRSGPRSRRPRARRTCTFRSGCSPGRRTSGGDDPPPREHHHRDLDRLAEALR
jgi:hypothetical protein